MLREIFEESVSIILLYSILFAQGASRKQRFALLCGEILAMKEVVLGSEGVNYSSILTLTLAAENVCCLFISTVPSHSVNKRKQR